ncbi:hypothetical protein DWB84_07220 [Saccharophagus sp. K07]|jgi:hypothetical protein|uniref:DUF7010 family protein n=1 Tax=Saccharophagus sp. K07 TaxID=2283636 RepID=UPI001652A799|nr:hypothetical protein [Saccharophagus sp. K07]MBC6905251.1 hypothetical protein [Saccharophagus sp. K07]
MDMSVTEAQSDMRQGYHSGAAGILASALAWFTAAGVAALTSPQKGILALLIGGMLIHPVGVLICKLLGSRGTHTKGNPFGLLAGASTFWLIFCLPIAYFLSTHEPHLFFPAMLLIIGGRYLVFATIYGMRLYWGLGLMLAGAGFAMACLNASTLVSALVGAVLESVFALACLVQHRRWVLPNNPFTATRLD